MFFSEVLTSTDVDTLTLVVKVCTVVDIFVIGVDEVCVPAAMPPFVGPLGERHRGDGFVDPARG